MVNIEAAKVLVECSKHIARWAKKGNVPFEKATPVQARAQENAWKLLVYLITFAEHAKESDLYWKLLSEAEKANKSAKEQARLRELAKSEDRGYARSKEDVESSLAEMLVAERNDPKALKPSGPEMTKKAAKSLVKKATKAPEKAVSKKDAVAKKVPASKKAVAAKKAKPSKKTKA